MAYNNDEIIKYYQDIASKQNNQISSMYDAQAQQLGAGRYDIKDMYTKAKSGAYATSRISALGNNEQLAAQGLAGNAYAKPTSGYSETSRIYQDVAMQNNLNALGESQRSALQELQSVMQSNQQNKMSALNQNQAYYDNQIMGARQNAYDTNFQLDQQNAYYLAQQAGDGVELDETQQALLGRFNYNYEQINQQYQKQYEEAQKQRQDQINAGFVDTYREMIEKGQTLTPEQKAIFDEYSAVTTDQYQSYITSVNDARFKEEYNAGNVDISTLKQYKSIISNDVYEKALTGIQGMNYTQWESRFNMDVLESQDTTKRMTYFTELDTAVVNQEISEQQRADILNNYYTSTIPVVSTNNNYELTLKDLNDDKDKLGSYYDTLKSALDARKPAIANVEKGIQASKDTAAGIGATSVGGTAVPLKSGGLAEGISSLLGSDAKKKDLKIYEAPSKAKYAAVDKSTGYGINSASLTLGEWVTVKYENGEEDDIQLDVYAGAKIKKEMKDANVETGQIYKASNGSYYMKGKNSYFKVKNVKESLYEN